MRTLADSIDKRIYNPQTLFSTEVLDINYESRYIQVNLGGNSGPQYIEVAASLDIGTANFPRVVVGMRALVERFYDSDSQGYGFVIRDLLVGAPSRMTAAVRINNNFIGLSAPTWVSLVMAGTDLQGNFTPVVGATGYELWANSASQLNSASLVAALTSNNFNLTLQLAATNIVLNGSFESGDLTYWRTDNGGGTGDVGAVQYVTTGTPNTGTYSLLQSITPNGGLPTTPQTLSQRYPIISACQYTLSFYVNILQIDAGAGATWSIIINWYNAACSLLSATTAYQRTTVTAGYFFKTRVVTPNPSAFFAEIQLKLQDNAAAMQSSLFVDDISLVGLIPPPNSTTYAIRAINSDLNISSPFSAWLPPQFASKQMGNSSASDAITHQGYLFSACSGLQISALGIADGGWCYPKDRWEYVGGAQFSASGDVSTRYQVDAKLRWKQGGGWLYGIVTGASFVSGSTLVALSGCTITTASITDNYYSYQLVPQGWSLSASGTGSSAVQANLNSDMVDGFHQDQDTRSTACPTFVKLTLSQPDGTAPLVVSSSTKAALLNADLLDNRHASVNNGDIPISTGTKNINLHADLLDGLHATSASGGARIVATDSSGNLDIGSGQIQSSSAIAARVYNNANISIANATWTDLTFNSERFNTDNLHASASRLTATRAGIYQISGAVSFDTNAVGIRSLGIYLNNTTYLAIIQIPVSNYFGDNLVVSTLYYLNPNDYVTLRVQQTSGGNLSVMAFLAISPEFMMARIA